MTHSDLKAARPAQRAILMLLNLPDLFAAFRRSAGGRSQPVRRAVCVIGRVAAIPRSRTSCAKLGGANRLRHPRASFRGGLRPVGWVAFVGGIIRGGRAGSRTRNLMGWLYGRARFSITGCRTRRNPSAPFVLPMVRQSIDNRPPISASPTRIFGKRSRRCAGMCEGRRQGRGMRGQRWGGRLWGPAAPIK